MPPTIPPAGYVLFYGWQVSPSNPFHLACFSQWFTAPFTDPQYPHATFPTSEHYMMYHKALLFDPDLAPKILESPSPAKAKALGRQVRNFDRATWSLHSDGIVERGNYLKFGLGQGDNAEMRRALFETRGKLLVEASPTDRIWGIGYSVEDAPGNEDKWGDNRMGAALTRARDKLIIEGEEDREAEGDKT